MYLQRKIVKQGTNGCETRKSGDLQELVAREACNSDVSSLHSKVLAISCPEPEV